MHNGVDRWEGATPQVGSRNASCSGHESREPPPPSKPADFRRRKTRGEPPACSSAGKEKSTRAPPVQVPAASASSALPTSAQTVKARKKGMVKKQKKALPRRRPSIHRDTGEATQTSPHGWQAGQWLLLRDSQGASSPFPRRGRKQPSNAPRLPLFSSRGGREEAVPFWARNHSGVAVRGQKKALGGTAGGTTRGP